MDTTSRILGPHPFADVFPLITGGDFIRLVEDIKTRGLLHPITLYDGKILDGRNRYRACFEAGVPPRTEDYTGDDPLGFVVSSNLERRHLNESQRSMVAARLATMRQGDNQHRSIDLTSQSEAAARLNVSVPSVKRAAVVRQRAVIELTEAVDQGMIAVSVAAKLCELEPEQQRKAAAEPVKAPHLLKRERRRDREVQLADAISTANKTLPTALFGVIYADPPWRFQPYSDETGMDRAAENHYPTMTLDDIKAIKVPAAPDSVLFLWATVPMLREALAVMDAWKFDYKSHFVWRKDKSGTGYWNRNRHELLLIGTRGAIPAPAPGEQFESVIDGAVQRHSAKPQNFRDIIEEMFPSIPRIELFARRKTAGWEAWGIEVSRRSGSQIV